MEVSFFFKKNVTTGEWEQSPLYTVFANAMKERKATDNDANYKQVSPVIHGYIEEQDTLYSKIEFKDAFKAIFGFDIFDFDAAYENSQIGVMLDSLEKAREVKSAYEFLKEKFGWKDSFSIYKYNDACGKGVPGYAVENDSLFEIPEIEKVE